MPAPKEITAWQMDAPGQPLVKRTLPVPKLGAGDVLVQVAGCGLCHTDLSFLYGGVKTKKTAPLTLGHEVAGTIVDAGAVQQKLVGKSVIVPAVLPCGECELCKAGRPTACRAQIMPGNDLDGGFATHLAVPGRFVCPVDPGTYELWELGVVADAVTTPFQAAERAGIKAGDVAVVIGTGGIGTYGVQICAAKGATVIAVDVDAAKLDAIRNFGAAATVNVTGLDSKSIKDAIRAEAKKLKVSSNAWKVFEMSGTLPGQATAYELITFAGVVGFIGFTMEKSTVRLGNLMAFDATLFGNWGCAPELYGPAAAMVLSGKVQIRPFSKRFPLDQINEVIEKSRAHQLKERPVLVP
ncbi:MAG: 6-hydroxycyclohex-1-ene-1-carbonyl-CoA dehydrogenase [Deltaproteobacteria bacterium]|nr:6-hydroxycyclohex-1-ene-1-carbonyl-CoA dehydrogenase [Deltaproteobacteria bacterium]